MKKIIFAFLAFLLVGVLTVDGYQRNKKKNKKKAVINRSAISSEAIGENASTADFTKPTIPEGSIVVNNEVILPDADNEAKGIKPQKLAPLDNSKVVYDRKEFTQEQWDKINGKKIIK